jgi:hypothetical protein
VRLFREALPPERPCQHFYRPNRQTAFPESLQNLLKTPRNDLCCPDEGNHKGHAFSALPCPLCNPSDADKPPDVFPSGSARQKNKVELSLLQKQNIPFVSEKKHFFPESKSAAAIHKI